MSDPKKFLIVGAGLSGVCVAIQLLREGIDVTLVDDGKNESSVIAAGMINPLVFRRMTKSWRVDEFLPYLIDFYTKLELETSASFFSEVVIRRLFSHEQEGDFWLDKQSNSEFENYMFPISEEDTQYAKAINLFGSGRVKNAFTVDARPFLESAKKWISERGSILFETVDYPQLDETCYKGIKYDTLVFCEGYHNLSNPWFGDLPINPTKGETLTISSENLPEDESLNRKCFVLPLGNKQFKIGSTYVWETPKAETSEDGKKEILENLSHLTPENVIVLDHEAGVRPTIRDRRPILGRHPNHPNYTIFNGMGAKGYMLAPLLSREFVLHLLIDQKLDPEVRVERFYLGR